MTRLKIVGSLITISVTFGLIPLGFSQNQSQNHPKTATKPMQNQLENKKEKQITTANHGHILTNIAVWSPDSQWLVYDCRSDLEGKIFDGKKIERVNVATGKVEMLYEAKNNACVGVATVNPINGKIVFIHGPENPNADWSYSFCHRQGVIVDPKEQGKVVALDARDIMPPFTAGALRGGSHVHTWDSQGGAVSFTYEDHTLTHDVKNGEPNRRSIGISFPNWPIVVPKTHARNHDGTYATVIVAKTAPNPKPGSDEIRKAFEDSWIPGKRTITFAGECIATDGRVVNEMYRLDLPEKFELPKPGPAERYPDVPQGFVQKRITRFTDEPGHTGMTITPRNWPRSSIDGKRLALLTSKGLCIVELETGKVYQLTAKMNSTLSWHPDSKHVCGIVDDSVALINAETGEVKKLTEKESVFSPPRPEACVISPDGKRVAFVRTVKGFNQIFTVDIE